MTDRDDLDMMHALAFFYWRHHQAERAAALAYGAFRLGKTDVRLRALLATALLDLGLPERTLAVLDQVAESEDPAIRRSIHCLRARALLHLGCRREAQDAFKRGIDLDPPESLTAA